MTHRTDDMSSLPPRIPVNAPKPLPKPVQADRPKLRLNQTAPPAGAVPSSPAPAPFGDDPDIVMSEGGPNSERVGEVGVADGALDSAAAAAASPDPAHAGNNSGCFR